MCYNEDMILKVGSANFFVNNRNPQRDAKFLAKLGCDVVGVQEGHSGNAAAIKKAIGNTHIVHWGKRKDAYRSFAMLDTPVVVHRRLDVIKLWARLVSNRAEKRNIGMQRAATAVRFRKDGKTVTFINVHLNAAVQNKLTKKPRSRKIKRVGEYVKSMIVVEAMIVRAKARGDLVVVVGDFNFSRQKKNPWKYSPQAMFARQGLKFKSRHLDYIAYSKEFTPSGFTVIPASRTGSDHPWLTLTLSLPVK